MVGVPTAFRPHGVRAPAPLDPSAPTQNCTIPFRLGVGDVFSLQSVVAVRWRITGNVERAGFNAAEVRYLHISEMPAFMSRALKRRTALQVLQQQM